MKPGCVYIAGPMRGHPAHNFPAFYSAADRFRRAGWIVRNPAEIGLEAFGNDPAAGGPAYMRADLRAICDVDAMALLPGWEQSTGARCEVVVAITLGLAFYDAESMYAIPAPSRVVVSGGYEKAAGAVDTLDSLRDEIITWSKATFPASSNYSRAKHLEEEIAEILKAPSDPEEWADAFFLVVQAEGFDLVAAVRAKLELNRARKWGKPDADGVVKHVADRADA
jgi:hypothetical protein